MTMTLAQMGYQVVNRGDMVVYTWYINSWLTKGKGLGSG